MCSVILIDMFGEYAALMRGIGSVFANAAMLLNPTIMGFIVTDHVSGTIDEVKLVFQ